MTAFLDLVQTEKSNETYFKFIKYLEEDYDWLAWTLKNTQITSDEILEYNKSSSQTCESSERERERERERVLREARRRHQEMEERLREEFREREGRHKSDSQSSRLSSPLHSSEFSISSVRSSDSGEERDRLSDVSSIQSEAQGGKPEQEISEQMISFVMNNSIILRRWQSLAHGAGLSHRLEVIKARVRAEGGDLDQHIAELIREWREVSPENATLSGLVRLLRDQNFNDTALRLENGSYLKRR